MRIEELHTPQIAASIYLIRGQKVMLDHPGFDLSFTYGRQSGPNFIFDKVNKNWDPGLTGLYDVEIKYLKRQVNRNAERFPRDFLYRLNKKEATGLRCQYVTLKNPGRGKYSKYPPNAFTEHGILMLSSVLNRPGFHFLLMEGSQGSPDFMIDEIDKYGDSPKVIPVNIAILRVLARIRQVLLENKDLAVRMEKAERHVEGHGKDIRSLFDHAESILAIGQEPKREIGFYPHARRSA